MRGEGTRGRRGESAVEPVDIGRVAGCAASQPTKQNGREGSALSAIDGFYPTVQQITQEDDGVGCPPPDDDPPCFSEVLIDDLQADPAEEPVAVRVGVCHAGQLRVREHKHF